jgi:hypothetical protein
MTISLWATTLLVPELLGVTLMAGFGYLVSEVLHLDFRFLDKALPLSFEFAIFVIILIVGAYLLLAVPAWTLENLSVRAALRRSLTLSRGSRARIIFVRVVAPVLAWILDYLLILLPFLLFAVALRGFGGRMFFLRHRLAFNMVADTVVAALIGPIFPIALTLFYYDQRIRKEGFDIERMMDAAGLNTTATLPAGDGAMANAGAQEGQA